jgi:hypothetical protein
VTTLYTAAPPIVDVVCGDLVVVAALGAWAHLTTPSNMADQRHENYHRLISASSCCAVAYYAASYLASALGGAGKLLAFLIDVNDGRHTWTVWVTLAAWAFLALFGGLRFMVLIGRPLGQRIGLPVGKYAILGALFGALWYFDMFFPVSRTDVTLWALAKGANFLLHLLYLAAVTEGVAALVLWCKPRTGAAQLAARELDRRSFKMQPARRD